jgi:hypothetical protein
VQPFVAYELGRGRTAVVSSEVTYKLEAAPGRCWTVPVSLAVSQVLPIGGNRFLQLGGGVTYYALCPPRPVGAFGRPV